MRCSPSTTPYYFWQRCPEEHGRKIFVRLDAMSLVSRSKQTGSVERAVHTRMMRVTKWTAKDSII